MKIEVWSDFVCPFCYIGKRKLEIALESFSTDEDVIVEYKSYELAPNAELNSDDTYYEMLANKFGMSIEEAKTTSTDLSRQAAEVGLIYRFDTMQSTNTFDAHRVAKYAIKHGKGNEMTERILKAYFSESEHIGDPSTLIKLAVEVGLSEKEVTTVLASTNYGEDVRTDEELAQQIGVQGVPFFVFNEKYAISGAQSPETFAEVFTKVLEEEKKELLQLSKRTKAKTTYCCGDDGDCEENPT